MFKPKKNFENIACIICGSNKCYLIKKTKYGNKVKCKKCGLIYANPRLKPGALVKAYSFEGDVNCQNKEDKNSLIKCYNKIDQDRKYQYMEDIKIIQKSIKKGKILDIGCAAGTFLELMDKKEWNCYGTDILDIRKNSVKKANITFLKGDFNDLDFKNNIFDVIYMSATFEHFSHPLKTLKKINSLLQPGGMIFISELPNINCLTYKKSHPKDLPPFHLFYYKAKDIKKMLKTSGFKDIKITSNYIGNDFLRKILLQNFDNPLKYLFKRLFDFFKIGDYLSPIIAFKNKPI